MLPSRFPAAVRPSTWVESARVAYLRAGPVDRALLLVLVLFLLGGVLLGALYAVAR